MPMTPGSLAEEGGPQQLALPSVADIVADR
jgi:hypothetical protein